MDSDKRSNWLTLVLLSLALILVLAGGSFAVFVMWDIYTREGLSR